MAKTRDEIRHEALEALRIWKRAGAGISMGVGKTRLGLDHFQLVVDKIRRDNDRMAKGLVAAPTKKILKSWKDEATKWGVSHLIEGLTFTTYRSATKYNVHDFDVIYLDECHSLTETHDPWLSPFTGYIIGLTGTPPKYKYSTKGKLVAKYCPIRYEYLTDEAVEDGILNDYRITVHLLELSDAKTHKVEIKDKKGNVTKSWYTSEKENYAYWTDRLDEAEKMHEIRQLSVLRMKAMQKYRSKEDYGKRLLEQSKEKCLLFANEQEQADRLCKYSYHSNNKDSERNMQWFETGVIDKMACVLQLAEGANIPGLKESVILHAYGNNKKAAQRIGRTLRLNPDDICHVHILCYKGTIDVEWVIKALADFNQEKIDWYDPDVF